MSKKLSKYIAAFDYIDKTLIFFVCNKWRNKYYLFSKCYWSSCRESKCKFYFNVFFKRRGNHKITEVTRKKKKTHNKIVMLAKSKLNSTDILMFQALIDLDISHEEFKAIVNEKEKYDQMKESIRNNRRKSELESNGNA